MHKTQRALWEGKKVALMGTTTRAAYLAGYEAGQKDLKEGLISKFQEISDDYFRLYPGKDIFLYFTAFQKVIRDFGENENKNDKLEKLEAEDNETKEAK